MRIGVQTKETREALLDATDRLLALKGYKKMTIDDLAGEVGIGKGSVYLHFPSKEEIALSHIDRIVERLKDQLEAIAKKDIPAREKLEQMLLARVLCRFDSVQHYKQSLDDLLADLRPKLLARREGYFRDEAAIFARVIETGQQNGEFQAGAAPETAEAFLLATNSLLPLSLTTDELGAREDIGQKTQRIARLLLDGIQRL